MRWFIRHRDRGEERMCKKIKELKELSANEISSTYWDGKIPVSLKTILSKLEIRFSEYDFSELEKGLQLKNDDAILGIAFTDKDRLGIIYSSRISRDAINYVLAHELAHCCLHMEPKEQFHVELKVASDIFSGTNKKSVLAGYSYSFKEIQADRFAADILIPTQALLDYLSNAPNRSIDDIAKHFHVSKEIVRLKVINLKGNKVGEN